MSGRLGLLAVAALALAAAHASGRSPGAAPATSSATLPTPPPAAIAPIAPLPPIQVPPVAFTKRRLGNGLELILHEDHTLPRVAVNIWYHVGPANEPPGRSGFAHLFEHLMFEGSRHIGGRFDRLMESAGATNVNGTTNWDRTNYFETVPRAYLPMVLWVESDRMAFMVDTLTAKRLDVQRDVVKNERRESYENAPYGPSELALYNALFPPGNPYHGAVIGSMADLSAATMDDVRRFYRAYYAPGNATLTIAGDFDAVRTNALVDKYFGSLPARPTPRTQRTPTPALRAPKRVIVDERVDLAKVTLGWITPPAYSHDDAILHLAMAVLAGGKATRMYRRLVVEQKLASDVDADLESNQLGSIAELSAVAASGASVADLERGVDEVLAALTVNGPTPEELSRAKRRVLLDLLTSLQLLDGPGGETGRAGMLQRFNHYRGDPGYLPQWVARLQAVTADDVKRALGAHLAPTASVTIITRARGTGGRD